MRVRVNTDTITKMLLSPAQKPRRNRFFRLEGNGIALCSWTTVKSSCCLYADIKKVAGWETVNGINIRTSYRFSPGDIAKIAKNPLNQIERILDLGYPSGTVASSRVSWDFDNHDANIGINSESDTRSSD